MARKPRNPSPTVERKIHFFRVDAGLDGSGKPLVFDPTTALKNIERLSFDETSSSRYSLDEDGNALCVWPEITKERIALRFAQVRRVGLPQLERGGAVTDLNVADDEGLLESIHAVFFENNIVGAEFNFYGPS